MKVLITGGTGFLGRSLTQHLNNLEYEVYSVGSKYWDLRSQHVCDTLLTQVAPDVIVHAAGSVGGIGANQENPGKFMYDNLIMGANQISSPIDISELKNNQRFNETLKFNIAHLYLLKERYTQIKPEVEALVEQIDAEIEQRNKRDKSIWSYGK